MRRTFDTKSAAAREAARTALQKKRSEQRKLLRKRKLEQQQEMNEKMERQNRQIIELQCYNKQLQNEKIKLSETIHKVKKTKKNFAGFNCCVVLMCINLKCVQVARGELALRMAPVQQLNQQCWGVGGGASGGITHEQKQGGGGDTAAPSHMYT